MLDFSMALSPSVSWASAILIAWIAGEFIHRWINCPRISVYGLVGFGLAFSQSGFLPEISTSEGLLLANMAFGLILFELGYRINLRWLLTNPWIGISSLFEMILTFSAVYGVVLLFGLSTKVAFLLAALSMASSPAVVVRVVNEEKSSGQVTERILHLSALNCILAVLVFKISLGITVFHHSGSVWEGVYSGLIVILISIALGVCLGILTPAILRATMRTTQDSTLAFAISVIFLVALTHFLKLSPILATIIFGVVVRHRRIVLNPSQRGFGALGDLFSVFLFVFIAATLDWNKVVMGAGLGCLIIAIRQTTKIMGTSLFAHISGISWRKGCLVGIGMAPISVFIILVLEQTRYLGITLVEHLEPLAAVALILEIFGPILTQRALIWAQEGPDAKGGS